VKKEQRILIVDDEPEFIEKLKAALKDKAFAVFAASNKMQAQQMIWGEKPDLVILGTIMPRGDAFLLHQWLKETPSLSDLPFVVIDAPSEKHLIKGWTKDEGLRLEADDFLVKPVKPVAVATRIEKLLDKATKRISVLVADDHPIVRDGIRALLTLQKDIQVVGEAVDGKDALEKAVRFLPDVVLMDIVMPEMNGLEATKHICKKCERVNVLMLTQYDDDENVLASSQVGALGFIPKKSVSSQLVAGIRSVSQGKRFMPITA